jgi:rubredoxin
MVGKLSIGFFNKDSETGEIKSKTKRIFNYEIRIQCPDCGSIFILNEYGEYFCKNCSRIYSESEIRARCGL